MYIIGLLVRIQTIALGVLLFCIETDNVCIVVYESDRPLPRHLHPNDLNDLPGGFANMSWIFEAVLMMLFICSFITSCMYIWKVITVCCNQDIDEDNYEKNVMPAVRRFKIWNTVFGISHSACLFLLFTHGSRVCAGWRISELPAEEQ